MIVINRIPLSYNQTIWSLRHFHYVDIGRKYGKNNFGLSLNLYDSITRVKKKWALFTRRCVYH